jgi:hypothetical protein
MTVGRPVVDIVDVYDTLMMSDSDKANDSCLVVVTNTTAETVVVMEGQNFGRQWSTFAVFLTPLVGGPTERCTPCFLTHKLARCIAHTSRSQAYRLEVVVVDQISEPVVYDYSVIVQAPSFASITPLMAPTAGGTLLVITGSNFKDRGFVQLSKGDVVLTCQTPKLGEEGDVNGVYYARDGKTIKVGGQYARCEGLLYRVRVVQRSL